MKNPEAAAPEELSALLEQVGRQRDRGAFKVLFAHFAPRLKSWLMRTGSDPDAAEELLQEVMVLVWRRAETFDATQANASTWIFTIARNRRIDSYRRMKRPEIDPEDPALVPDQPDSADDLLDAARQAEVLRRAIKHLPPEQLRLIRLAYYEDRPHSEIAEMCNLPLGTVKSRLRLAVRRLGKLIGNDGALISVMGDDE